jgi:hypothetical protein
MKLGFIFFASALLLACDQGKTDIGDLPVDSESGGETGGETGTTTTGVDCSGESCLDGCCEGFGCNFMAVCEACTPEGEIRTVDGAGCCEGLATAPTMLCFDSVCDDGMCAPGTCAGLDPSQHNDAQQFAYDCAPEVCVPSLELVLANASGAPGLECAGPGGSSECAASGGAEQQFVYESDALRLTVRFDAAILDGYSTESFNQHFDSVAGQLTIEDATVPITTFVETGTVSSFTYVDGRLQFTIDVPLADAFATIESDAEDCISDDIAGVCACYYDGLGTYRVVVDLEIEAP